MKIKLRDLQFSDKFFGGDGGIMFDDEKEACEQLISYHETDTDMNKFKELKQKKGYSECLKQIAENFEWEIIRI